MKSDFFYFLLVFKMHFPQWLVPKKVIMFDNCLDVRIHLGDYWLHCLHLCLGDLSFLFFFSLLDSIRFLVILISVCFLCPFFPFILCVGNCNVCCIYILAHLLKLYPLAKCFFEKSHVESRLPSKTQHIFRNLLFYKSFFPSLLKGAFKFYPSTFCAFWQPGSALKLFKAVLIGACLLVVLSWDSNWQASYTYSTKTYWWFH